MEKQKIQELFNKYATDLAPDFETETMNICDFTKFLEDNSIPMQLPVMLKIAGIRWEQRYSTTLEDDKYGRWMRLGRINGMTVAIILKVKERFIVKLPNNKGDESLENAIIVTSENEAMLEAEKYIAKYVSNFSA